MSCVSKNGISSRSPANLRCSTSNSSTNAVIHPSALSARAYETKKSYLSGSRGITNQVGPASRAGPGAAFNH